MKPHQFPPHGEFSLAWCGDVLLVTYSGDWNRQAVLALHEAAMAAWASPPRRPWAMLSDARDWTGSSDEVFEQWWIFYQDAVAHGMTTVTDVLPSKFYELMVKDLFAQAKAIANYHHSHSIDEAWKWLAGHGFGPQM